MACSGSTRSCYGFWLRLPLPSGVPVPLGSNVVDRHKHHKPSTTSSFGTSGLADGYDAPKVMVASGFDHFSGYLPTFLPETFDRGHP